MAKEISAQKINLQLPIKCMDIIPYRELMAFVVPLFRTRVRPDAPALVASNTKLISATLSSTAKTDALSKISRHRGATDLPQPRNSPNCIEVGVVDHLHKTAKAGSCH